MRFRPGGRFWSQVSDNCSQVEQLMYSATYGHFAIRTYPLENDQKWPFSRTEVDHISLLLSVEKGAFYMDPMRGSCKLNLCTSGNYKTGLSNVLGI